jgi:hypothetical protein
VASLGAESVTFEHDRTKPEVDVSLGEGVAAA